MFKSVRLFAVTSIMAVLFATGANADTGFEYLQHLIDSARVMGASTFAPNTMSKAESEFSKAENAVIGGKAQKSIDQAVAKATEYTENAIRATEVAKLSLNEYLGPRQKALDAKAVSLVPELYMDAEQVFVKAAYKVESGDVKGGLKEAAKSTPLYDVAELEAIRKSILGGADALIEKAEKDDAHKYAVSTLDKAHTARNKADAIITSNRYNRGEAEAEAKRAEYEARHASNIALSVRSLKKNDQAWEKLMLVYEIQMNRVGETIGANHLPFDNGPLAAADSLIHYIDNMQQQNEYMTDKFAGILDETGENSEVSDPQTLADKASQKVETLFEEKQTVSHELEGNQAKLTNLEHKHQSMKAELSQRQQLEDKLNKAKSMFTPADGQVFLNATNDIVLSLSGISFDIGKAFIKESHLPLLQKVSNVIKMFPNAILVVEGHTDASGGAVINMTLSEKRAFAIMQFLRQTMQLPADKIKSMGYGSDKPVASNQTKDGRAQNRRIDVVIMLPSSNVLSSAE